MFGLLEAEGLTFIPIKVGFSCLGKRYIIFVFPFLNLLCDMVRGCCWVIASITVSVRQSSIKVLRCYSYVVLSWETNAEMFSPSTEGDSEYVLRRL